jgi:hypothetical protein
MNWLKTRLSQDYKIYKNYARKKAKEMDTHYLTNSPFIKQSVLL